MTGKRAKLAIFSPVSPMPSGISDYCEASLELLGHDYECTVVVDGYQPVTEKLPNNVSVIQAETLRKTDFKSSFDLPIYHIGNSPHHNYIYPFLFAWPGLMLLHDAWIMATRLHAALDAWQGDAFRQEMQMGYGEARGWDVAEIILSGLHNQNFLRYFPMVELPVKSSRMTLVHQVWLKRKLERELDQVVIRTLPHYQKIASKNDETTNKRTRKELGIAEETFVVGMFGGVVPEKKPETCLRAFHWLKQRHEKAQMLIVGSCGSDVPLESLISELDLDDSVIRTGRVSDQEYFNYMQACNCQLLLRWPTNRESSAVLLNAMNLGQIAIISNLAHFAEFPENSVLRIDVDSEELQLRKSLLWLLENPDRGKEIGVAAMTYAHEKHGAQAGRKAWREAITEYLKLPQKEAIAQEQLPQHLRFA